MHSAATDQAFNLEAWLHLEALARIRRSGPAVKNTSLEDVSHNPAAADNIQSRDDGQPASPDRHDRPPALPSRDRDNADIQASRLAELTAPIIITMMSRAGAGGAVSSS
jgi:hypothetical protein